MSACVSSLSPSKGAASPIPHCPSSVWSLKSTYSPRSWSARAIRYGSLSGRLTGMTSTALSVGMARSPYAFFTS